MMEKLKSIKPPFFEIGPKSYLVGDEVLDLALKADNASAKYNVDIIFTCPFTEIRRVSEETKYLHVFAPHMDPTKRGRGLADILPEAVVAAGAQGVMLNHCEKPITFSVLEKTVQRAKEMGLMTIVCANSIAEASAVARLNPTIIIAEQTDLVGTGKTSDSAYIKITISEIKSINPKILVLQGAGIKNGKDVGNVIASGAEATGSSSGIVKAENPGKMIDEMIAAVRETWDRLHA